MLNLSIKAFARLGEDLRKAGFLMNVGFVGVVVDNDIISVIEGFSLFIWGFYCWSLGHYFIYLSEARTQRNCRGDNQ